MAEETESGATLLAKKEYARAVPLLKREHEKYPSNPRIRLQFADALAGAGQLQRVVVPAYTYYWTAYQTLLERGYHVDFTMVRMKRGKQEDYEDASDLVLDDWR